MRSGELGFTKNAAMRAKEWPARCYRLERRPPKPSEAEGEGGKGAPFGSMEKTTAALSCIVNLGLATVTGDVCFGLRVEISFKELMLRPRVALEWFNKKRKRKRNMMAFVFISITAEKKMKQLIRVE
ncbi:hypothetical protein Cni_G09358 [Canna indica]|uniref:Uncharacterized protein n=1 Tax=Canna indica TaxID=4628 RepID=A0AAQ3Q9J4_9LILI|nr:hypothetical protein Cni_G09358 [Canna indica]